MSTNTSPDHNRTASTDTPRTAIRDAVLADASPNVADHDVIDGLLWVVEQDSRRATISGAGGMVDFADYNEVRL